MTPTQHNRLRDIIEAVNALPATFPDFQAQATAVCEIFESCGYVVWQEFDERSWSRCKDRFGLVRQVRNSPDAGRRLFAAVNRKRKRKSPTSTLSLERREVTQ
jgi:hypothetical protein